MAFAFADGASRIANRKVQRRMTDPVENASVYDTTLGSDAGCLSGAGYFFVTVSGSCAPPCDQVPPIDLPSAASVAS